MTQMGKGTGAAARVAAAMLSRWCNQTRHRHSLLGGVGRQLLLLLHLVD